MRKLSLLAAVAGVAISGSLAQADFVLSSVRTPNALTLGAQSYDLVTFKVLNDGNNGTGTKMSSIDVALLAPTTFNSQTFANNGMLLGSAFGEGDVFNINSPPSGSNQSAIKGAGLSSNAGAKVLLLNGTLDSTPYNSSTYTDQQLVAGISGTIFSTASFPPANSTAYTFARAYVPTGNPVEILAPNALRAFEPNSGIFTGKNADNSVTTSQNVVASNFSNGAFVDPGAAQVPEPTSLAVVGIGAAGLLARRRRTA